MCLVDWIKFFPTGRKHLMGGCFWQAFSQEITARESWTCTFYMSGYYMLVKVRVISIDRIGVECSMHASTSSSMSHCVSLVRGVPYRIQNLLQHLWISHHPACLPAGNGTQQYEKGPQPFESAVLKKWCTQRDIHLQQSSFRKKICHLGM